MTLTDAQARALRALREGSVTGWLDETLLTGPPEHPIAVLESLSDLDFATAQLDSTDPAWNWTAVYTITPAGLSALAQHEAQA